MDHAHEELVKVVEEGGGNLFLQSIAKTGRVWRDVCIDEGEGSFPSGLVVQCLRSLEVFEERLTLSAVRVSQWCFL